MAVGLLLLGGAGTATNAPQAAALIAKAHDDIVRGDGLGAELHLKAAQAAGASRNEIAARMGEAFIYQGKREKAREWLAPGKFAPDEAAHGFHLLGLLEHGEGNLAAAGRAYDQATALAPESVSLWVDLGYLRYASGEHMKAIEAADRALSLDPKNVRALEFRGLIVRDQYGMAAALPWLEAALVQAPDDRSVLREYAATLGDLGRGSEMLASSRKLMARDARNARGLLLLAELAMRADDIGLARTLLNRTGDQLKNLPAKLLLEGILEMRRGNNLLAIEALEPLVQRQPGNVQAQELLASAYYANGDARMVVRRFGTLAERIDASPYLLTVVARAHEVLGERDQAVPLLQRAARSADRPFAAVPENQPVGSLLVGRDFAGAEAAAERMRAAQPGSADAQAQAGDVQLLLGHGVAAVERYRLASRVRMPESLLQRMVAAMVLAGQQREAAVLVEAYLVQTPSSPVAVRLAASVAAGRADWSRARQLLEFLRANGSAGDVHLLADLSQAQLRSGDAETAEATAREAYRLAPSNPLSAKAWGLCLNALKQRPADARALLARAGA
ncbi:MAG: tetratricopeptide repeat protein [Novosphingobium sp.]